MMSHLEAIKPGRTTSLGATLHRLADRFKRRCLIILVSDLYDDPEAVEPALHHFHYKRHEVIVFHVLDHAEITFPFRDTASFIDMETGERLQVDPAYVRDEYRRQLDAFIDRYRKICADCQFDYVLTDTSVPFDSMLSRYLENGPGHDLRCPALLAGRARRVDSGLRAPDPSPEGQGGPL